MHTVASLGEATQAAIMWQGWMLRKRHIESAWLLMPALKPGDLSIYFALAGDLIKVGRTSQRVDIRAAALSRQLKVDVHVLGEVVGCARVCEAEFLHMLAPFSRRRSQASREWFKPCVEIDCFLEFLGAVACTKAA